MFSVFPSSTNKNIHSHEIHSIFILLCSFSSLSTINRLSVTPFCHSFFFLPWIPLNNWIIFKWISHFFIWMYPNILTYQKNCTIIQFNFDPIQLEKYSHFILFSINNFYAILIHILTHTIKVCTMQTTTKYHEKLLTPWNFHRLAGNFIGTTVWFY